MTVSIKNIASNILIGLIILLVVVVLLIALYLMIITIVSIIIIVLIIILVMMMMIIIIGTPDSDPKHLVNRCLRYDLANLTFV